MHGRKKVTLDEANKIKIAKKTKMLAEAYTQTMNAINHKEENPDDLKKIINSSCVILDTLSDFATLWNLRKENFKQHHTLKQLKIELDISQRVVLSNPKCYWTWHHRRWCYEYLGKELGIIEVIGSDSHQVTPPPTQEEEKQDNAVEENTKEALGTEESKEEIEENTEKKKEEEQDRDVTAQDVIDGIRNEINLCDIFIKHDSRNFHAWRHRRWAVKLVGDMYDKEVENSRKFIEADFSNYSAWHYRSQLPGDRDFATEELDMTKSAFFTDPADQSAWIYYRWILSKPAIANDADLLNNELRDLGDLHEMEPKCKYPILGMLWVAKALGSRRTTDIVVNGIKCNITDLKDKLCELDPIRAAYYKEL